MSNILDLFINKVIIVLSKYKDRSERNSYITSIKNSYVKLTRKKDLTKSQKQEIQEYYTALWGHKIPLDWHRYFYSRTDVFSVKYMPTSLYRTEIIGRLNDYTLKKAYTDKNITDLILPMAPQPKSILKNMNGCFFFEGIAVSREQAIDKCKNIGEVIIKPSNLSRGRGIQKLHVIDGTNIKDNQSLSNILDGYKKDYLIQEVVHQHQRMESLNPTSVNTIRLLTYRKDMEVMVVYSVIRIGRKDQTIDNESAGGISARINSDGRLAKYAYGAPGVDKVEYTDSGVKLEGYEIPSFESAMALTKKLHLQLPFFSLVGWDIAIDKEGNPIMIEFNVNPDLSQSANGPAFGEHTEMIVKEAMKRSNTWSQLARDCIYRRL